MSILPPRTAPGPVLAAATAVVLLATVSGPPALAQPKAPFIVVDASSGQVVLQDDATMPWNPASTTKMMTAFVALRAVKAGRISLDTPLIASANAARQRPSKIGIRPGQTITLDNALKIMMVRSANDLAVVIAEAIGGSVPGFSSLMNAEAQRLGMTETRLYNPHGFHQDGHQTSARDLAILARAMLTEMPEYADYWGIGAVQMGNRVMHNTNGLMGRYAGATGLKTGFVCAAGFNLVATANRGGRTLIAVVLGAASGGERTVRAAQLLDQGFGSYGGGQTLSSLPRSGFSSAPNMRAEICGRRRSGVVLADDSDYGGAILGDTFQGESFVANSAVSFFQMSNGGGQAARVAPGGSGVRASGGRPILGPRVAVSPIPVHFGPAPGSTAVAVGPGGQRLAVAPAGAARGATAATAVAAQPGAEQLPPGVRALAPLPGVTESPRPATSAAIRQAPAAAPAATPAPPAESVTRAAARADERADEGGGQMPLQLIAPGTAPRPGAAAGIAARQPAPALRGTTTQQQRPAAGRSAPVRAKPPKARAQQPRGQQARAQQPAPPPAAAPRRPAPAN